MDILRKPTRIMKRKQMVLGFAVLGTLLVMMKYMDMQGTSSVNSDGRELHSTGYTSDGFDFDKKDQFSIQAFKHNTDCVDTGREPVHFCIAAGQTGVMNELSVLLKSMFLHSNRSDLFLHFLVDVESEQDIHTFMSAFHGRLQTNVNYELKLLDTDFVIKEATKMKILIKHHSGVFGMSKLFFYKIWGNLERCITLDVDLVFAQDPALLWEEFNKMDNQSAIMMRVDKHVTVCNSGVVLERYDMMRKLNFDKLCAEGVIRYCIRSESDVEIYDCGKQGDQRLFHLVYLQFPTLYTQIDSSWNLERCHNFEGFNFSTGQGRGRSRLYFGIAHFNCLHGDDSFAEFQKQKNYVHLKSYVKEIQDLNSSDFTEGRCLVQRVSSLTSVTSN